MDVSISENNGNVFVGERQYFFCHCGGGCSGDEIVRSNFYTETSSFSRSLKDALLENVYDTNSEACPCTVSSEEIGKRLIDLLSDKITDVIQDRKCPNFEVLLKVRGNCKICQGNSIGHSPSSSTTELYSSKEIEVKLPHPTQSSLKRMRRADGTDNVVDFKENKSFSRLEPVTRVKGSFIQVKAIVDETGTNIKFKFLLDVKRSTQRRCKSLSEFDRLKRQRVLNRVEESSTKQLSAKSHTSLSTAKSCISIAEMSVDINCLPNIGSVPGNSSYHHACATAEQNKQVAEAVVSKPDSFQDFPDEVLGETAVYIDKGQFGPLYKKTEGGKVTLVKIVGDNPKFLEGELQSALSAYQWHCGLHMINESEDIQEAKQFCNCTHPFIRPTVDVVENSERSYVVYRYVDGATLCKAIQDKHIKCYTTYCRILFGIVKGLCYLREKKICCRFLSTEKVLLDSNFNPRICGVGLAYFDDYVDSDDPSTNVGDFHRSLSYLDRALRSSNEKDPKNVMWSLGRIIWEMLLGAISQNPSEEDLLAKYNIIEHLEESWDDKKIKTVLFNPELRKLVYAAGWPNNKEITKSLVVCAVRCLLLNLKERMSLEVLYGTLANELCALQKTEKFSLYQVLPHGQCIFCMAHETGRLALTCGCSTACNECLRNVGPLYCPEHGRQFSKIGHPATYGVILEGEFTDEQNVCGNDASAMESIFKDQNIFAIKNVDRIKLTTENKAREEIDKVKNKIMRDKKLKNTQRYPTTLFLFISGHCKKAGNVVMPDKSSLKKQYIAKFIDEVNAKNVIVLASGHYTEQLMNKLCPMKFFNSNAFFGVFTHAGNLCSMSHKNVCERNSTTIKYILDILKNDEVPKTTCSAIPGGHINIKDLIQSVNERMRADCGKSLQPIDCNGAGYIPVAYR